jgi:hypothetical protein
MTTRIIAMFWSSLGAFILGLVLSPRLMPAADPQRADAAFSDGVFQATLDFQSGRRPHFAAGRWNRAQDRFSFAKGYDQRWRELFKDGATTVPAADDARLTGYWDGIVEGALAGKTEKPFQVAAGDKIQAGGVHASLYSESEKQRYLEGYAAGYKAGYVAEH